MTAATGPLGPPPATTLAGMPLQAVARAIRSARVAAAFRQAKNPRSQP